MSIVWSDFYEAISHTDPKIVHFLSVFDFLRNKWSKVAQIILKSQNFSRKHCSKPFEGPIYIVRSINFRNSSPPLNLVAKS